MRIPKRGWKNTVESVARKFAPVVDSKITPAAEEAVEKKVASAAEGVVQKAENISESMHFYPSKSTEETASRTGIRRGWNTRRDAIDRDIYNPEIDIDLDTRHQLDLVTEAQQSSGRNASVPTPYKVTKEPIIDERGVAIANAQQGIVDQESADAIAPDYIPPQVNNYEQAAETSANAEAKVAPSPIVKKQSVGEQAATASDTNPTGSKLGRNIFLGTGAVTGFGGITLALSASRGQQSNAQLYGQQPINY